MAKEQERPVANPASVKAGSLAELSRRERVIAARFAEGLTHREIGAALFIAPATVRTHLGTIYRKLGVHNKVALAGLIAGLGASEEVAPAVDGGTDDADDRARGGPLMVAVLPFENLAGNGRWDRLADGLTVDIIADLARRPELRVVARHTMLAYKGRAADLRTIGRELGAGYVLEGSVQADGGRVRVTAQLADAGTGAQLWTERFERAESELFAIQDEVATSVVNALGAWGGRLVRARREVARRKPPASLEAYDLYLLGLERKHLFTKGSTAEAIRLLARAVELDPGLARAWTTLGLAHGVAALNAFAENADVAIGRWRECADMALMLDPADPIARMSMGELRAMDGDLAGAAEEYRRALDLSPIAPPWYFSALGRAEYVQGDYPASIAALRQAPSAAPATLLFLAMAHARLGEAEPAGRLVARLGAEFPTFTVGGFIRYYPVTNPPALAAIREGAAEAGLPPESLIDR